jgi:predicted PurR-regulated permease PerM
MKELIPGERLLTLQRQLSVLVLALFGVLLLYQVCSFFSDILRILGISILFSYLLIGLVDLLQKYLHSRAFAVLVIYAIVVSGTVIGAVLFVPVIMTQISQLLSTTYDQLPAWVESLTKTLMPIQQRLNAAQIQIKVIDILNDTVASLPRIEVGQLFNRVSDVAVSTMTWTLYALSILVVSFYFLLDGYRMKNAIIRLFPYRHEQLLHRMASDIDGNLQSFFRGQILLGLGFGALMVPVFSMMGVHYALLLGVFLGIWEIIPVIGSTIGIIPAIMAVAINGMDMIPASSRITQVLLLFLVFQGLQWLKDNIVAPRYIGNVIGLHPVVIFLAIMIGARIDGMLGIIFAIPVACVLNVLFSHPIDDAESAVSIPPDSGSAPDLKSASGNQATSDIAPSAPEQKSPERQPGSEQLVNPAS